MKAQVFAHKGIVGICALVFDKDAEDGYILSEAIVNDISQPGQLGCVCDGSKVEFSQEAIDLLKTVPKSRDAIGEVDIFGDKDDITFGWLGGPTRMVNVKQEGCDGSRDYDISLYDHVTVVPNNPPTEFVEAVDRMLAEQEVE